MEKAKIRPLATPKPLKRSSPKLDGVIMSWMAPRMQNSVAIGSGVSVPQIRDFAVFGFFMLQPRPLDGYLRKIRSNDIVPGKEVSFGGPITIFYIWTLKFPKNRHFRDRFLLDSFYVTWGCSNINYP